MGGGESSQLKTQISNHNDQQGKINIMNSNYQEMKDVLGNKVKENEILAPYTSWKIGGPADLFYEARTREEFVRAVIGAVKLKIPIFVLGGGSNILVGDKGYRGFVVRNLTREIKIVGMKGQINEGKNNGVVYVDADSGVAINTLVRYSVEEGLKGLEMHLGLPGSVGGAVYMNSKWTHPDGYVGEMVYQAQLIDKKGNLRIVPRDYFHFAYDYSSIQKSGEWVISVTFAFKRDSKVKLWEIANESIGYRRSTQPQGVVSAGCVFKNLSRAGAIAAGTPGLTQSAGFLIDNCGLKGRKIGGAQISTEHANFFCNSGGASASDMLQLIDLARQRVMEKFGVNLEEEIVRLGEFK